jgi:hypothetical protein
MFKIFWTCRTDCYFLAAIFYSFSIRKPTSVIPSASHTGNLPFSNGLLDIHFVFTSKPNVFVKNLLSFYIRESIS